jgi:Mn2+/Fe2+ NRAMP family transporter
MGVAAAAVLTPGAPLGLLTEGVQTLAGVLLPSATVFLLLLSNDKEVLAPWVNSKKLNVFTGAVIWVLVVLSVILTASVLFPLLPAPRSWPSWPAALASLYWLVLSLPSEAGEPGRRC